MNLARAGWAALMVFCVAACRDFTPPDTPPLVTVTAAEEAGAPRPSPQAVHGGAHDDSYADTERATGARPPTAQAVRSGGPYPTTRPGGP
jgi:hypothetical protein